MTMTYAAQVRSVPTSLPKQVKQDKMYDVNSLRIICQYFVGSVVVVRIRDDILEGVLYTIFNDKICLTLVTTANVENPEIITKITPSMLISLDNVMCISTSNSEKYEVTVRGKHRMNVAPHNSSIINKPSTSIIDDQSDKTNIKVREDLVANGPNADQTESEQKKPLIVTEVVTEKKPEKMSSFNPNAPEFRPRPCLTLSDSVAESVSFSPHIRTLPNVFTPNSAPAIFVPNLFFYSPNNVGGHNMDYCMDSVMSLPSNISLLPNFNGPMRPLPYAPVVPMFLPGIGVPPPCVPEIVRHQDNGVNRQTIDLELSCASNWPPLPLNTVPSTSNHNGKI